MSNSDVKRLDIGCGNNKMPGATYLDFDEIANPDILHDLNIFPYPIEDNSFDEIIAKHIIEHLDHPQEFIEELCRVCKPGGTIFIETPHFSSYVAYSEPQHRLFYSYFLLSNLVRPIPIKTIKQEITFYKVFRFVGISFLANKCPRTYERFWTYMFPAENVKILLKKE